MRLEVRRLDVRGPRAALQAFEWAQVAAFVHDPATDRMNYQYVSDPEPLLVGADNAESPLGVFNGPRDWYFEAGTYEVTLVADLAVAKEEKRYAPFRLAFTPEQIDQLDRSQGRTFLEFPLRGGETADGTLSP